MSTAHGSRECPSVIPRFSMRLNLSLGGGLPDPANRPPVAPRLLWLPKPRYPIVAGAMPTVAEAFRTAVAHHEAGQLAEAEALYTRILAVAPDHAGCLHRLGGLALASGRHDRAIALIGRAMAIDDREPVYPNTLGNALYAQGRLEAAAIQYRRALALKPDYAGARYNLGNVLKAQGRTVAALAAFEQVLALWHDHAETLNNLGAALLDLGRLDEAVARFRQALAVRAEDAEVHFNLGVALQRQGRLPEAVAHYRRAIGLRPDHAEALGRLGTALLEQGKLDEAIARLERAAALQPDAAEVHNNLGTALLDQGRFDEAAARFERALRLRPDYAEAHFNRTEIPGFRLDEAGLSALEALAADGGRLPADKAPLVHFALARVLEEREEPARAFGHLLTGNALRRRQISYEEAAFHDFFRRIAAVFDAGLFQRRQGTGEPSTVPIFVLGMPRSGSSLVEQILASHPEVHGGGELTTLVAVATGATGGRGPRLAYPEDVPALDEAALRRLGRAYLAGLPPLPAGKTRITDKMPYNFLNIGLIRLILPGARIIHTRRNPADTCVSCFSKLFPFSQAFSYDLGELGRYYRDYRALMAHWHSVLPEDALLDLSYEALVDDLEVQARRLLAWCGLPWDDRCLDFHETRRPVRTASAAQVRQPLFRSSLERWRRYQPWLQPLLRELDAPAPPLTAPDAADSPDRQPRRDIPVWEIMVARAGAARCRTTLP